MPSLTLIHSLVILICSLLTLTILFIDLYGEYRQHGKVDVFRPIYPLTGFWFFLFIVRPIYLFFKPSGINPLDTSLLNLPAFSLAIVIATVGWLIFFYAYERTSATKFRLRETPIIAPSYRSITISILVFITVGSFTVYAMLQTIYEAYGFRQLIFGDTITIIYETRASGRFLFEYFRKYIMFGFFFAFSGVLRYRTRLMYFLNTLLFPAALVTAVMSGYRWSYILLFGVPLIVLHYERHRFRLKIAHVTVLLPLLLIALSALNAVRADISLSRFKILGALTALRPFDDFVVLIHSLNLGDAHYQLGLQYLWRLSGVAFFPRILWEGKPIVSSGLLYTWEVYGVAERSTHTLTIPGEMYYQFNIFGVVVGMFLFGRLWRYLYDYLRRFSMIPIVPVMYGYLLLMGINTFRSSFGSFLVHTVLTIPVFVLPLVIESYLYHVIDAQEQMGS